MLTKAVFSVLKRDGWSVALIVATAVLYELYRGRKISILTISASTLTALIVILLAKVPNEIGRLRTQQETSSAVD